MDDYAQGCATLGPAMMRLDEALEPGESILDSTGRVIYTRPAPPETDDD